MKKISLIALALVMALALVACGGAKNEEAGIVGSWTISSGVDAEGNEITSDMVTQVFGDIDYTFNEDGTMSCTALGQTVEGTYEFDGENVAVNAGGSEVSAAFDGSQLTFENADGSYVYMVRK